MLQCPALRLNPEASNFDMHTFKHSCWLKRAASVTGAMVVNLLVCSCRDKPISPLMQKGGSLELVGDL